MSIVLPVPTDPYRYRPLGTFSTDMVDVGVEGVLEKNLPNYTQMSFHVPLKEEENQLTKLGLISSV